jgi:hypothetical protein
LPAFGLFSSRVRNRIIEITFSLSTCELDQHPNNLGRARLASGHGVGRRHEAALVPWPQAASGGHSAKVPTTEVHDSSGACIADQPAATVGVMHAHDDATRDHDAPSGMHSGRVSATRTPR